MATKVIRLLPGTSFQVLFGSRRGQHFTDNAPELFEWVLGESTPGQVTWMADEKLAAELRGSGLPVCRRDGLAGVTLPFRATAGVVSVDLRDISLVPQFVPDDFRLLFLGHGKSVKRTRLAMPGADAQGWWREQLARWPKLVGAAAASSPFIADLASVTHNIPRDRFVITGYPRDDLLFSPRPGAEMRFREFVGDPKSTVVLYAPTWRHGREPTAFLPFPDRDLRSLRHFLRSERILLLLRPHLKNLYDETVKEVARIADGEHIRLCTASEVKSVNDVLPFTDALISDYSSIYHDYLLLDRPIVLIPYDADQFAEEQGFAYDYDALRPGLAVTNQADLIEVLADIKAGGDPGANRRSRLSQLVHTHGDGRARQRLADVLNALQGADHVVGADDGSWRPVPY